MATSVASLSAFGQVHPVDITAAVVDKGAVIEDLKVVEVNGIVILRGKTNDARKAAKAARIVTDLGHARIANLIAIRDDATDDAAIEYTARRRLELERALEGCRFHVDSNRGVVRLTGRVRREMQADLALQILRRIEGVKEIDNKLTKL
jgi:osmotically-inducible protein OsmY